MLTLPKLLVLLLIILAVWYGYKWMARVNHLRASGQGRTRGDARRQVKTQEMAECPVCGVFVPAAGAAPCGRPDCPYRP